MIKVNPSIPIVDNNGRPQGQFQDFLLEVAATAILDGTGSPEGVVAAPKKTLYMDDAGTAGAILYIKRDTDIAGDNSQGWILV